MLRTEIWLPLFSLSPKFQAPVWGFWYLLWVFASGVNNILPLYELRKTGRKMSLGTDWWKQRKRADRGRHGVLKSRGLSPGVKLVKDSPFLQFQPPSSSALWHPNWLGQTTWRTSCFYCRAECRIEEKEMLPTQFQGYYEVHRTLWKANHCHYFPQNMYFWVWVTLACSSPVAWVWISVLPLLRCLTFDNLFNLSFHIYKIRTILLSALQGYCQDWMS